MGTVVIKETRPLPGYTVEPGRESQTITVNPQETQTATFYNIPANTLTIQKYIDGTDNEPLAGVEFLVTDSTGAVVGPNNGYYTTDKDGRISIPGLTPGTTVTIKETKTLDGFILDGQPQSITIKEGEAQSLTFRNKRAGGLIINKIDALTKEPLAGVKFKITYADGSNVDLDGGKISSSGLYTTDSLGQIKIPGIVGTVIVEEIETLPGYVIDPNTKRQTVQVNANDTQTITFENVSVGGLELIKVSASDKTKRIPNTTFEIRKMDGGLVTTVSTDSTGRVHVDLDAGDYYAVETEAGKGFKIDATPQYFTVKDGETTTLTVTNKALSGIQIHKIDSASKKGIYGVTFLLYDSTNTPIGQYTSDDQGYVYIEDITEAGRYYLKELENEGYLVDTQMKTVYVKPGEVTLVEWENTAITGQIQITKTSEDYNSMNGWPAGTPIPGTVFEIYDKANNLVDTIRTDKNGLASSRPLPLGRYKVVESQSADFYGLDKTPMEAEIEFSGQIVRLAMTNKALYTNVSINKRGYAQVMPGQAIRYDFTGIANNSTTALSSFYWRDTLPSALRLDKIVTGTYNVQGNYKIVYKTNLSGETYRVIDDNVSTTKNSVVAASPAALGLASGEYVTEVMFVFGVVPSNFRQVEAPQIHCNVISWVKGGAQFVNQADVGGVYNGQWIMATDRWVTTVYKPAKPSKPLPRTGY
nr:SpaA isopeptide-forming pilin-related protein [uncultured Oscillibacter sp.]